MQQRIIWIHGIGQNNPGYSAAWTQAFNTFFRLGLDSYLEVCWNTVFQAAQAATRSADGGEAVGLTAQEQFDEQQVREDLETILLARASALQQAEAPAMTRGGGDGGTLEWPPVATRGALDWFFNPDEYIGDFTKYLVSRSVRTAVKAKVKEQLQPLVGGDYRISIIGHSWGTVVGYDSLLDLEIEQPGLQVANLITLGSPLWLVRRLLEDRSGRKPGNAATWVNVHARGDLVGSWLHPGFRIDKEFQVSNFGGGGAHSSYFVPNNEAVQRDIVARYVLA